MGWLAPISSARRPTSRGSLGEAMEDLQPPRAREDLQHIGLQVRDLVHGMRIAICASAHECRGSRARRAVCPGRYDAAHAVRRPPSPHRLAGTRSRPATRPGGRGAGGGGRLLGARRERPPRVRPAVARRPVRARGGRRPDDHDPADDLGRAARDPGTRPAGEVAHGDRPAVGRPPRRGRRAGELGTGLRGGGDPVRGALAALRRGGPGAPSAAATRRRAVHRPVLLDRGRPAGARAPPARRPAPVARQLGVGGRDRARRAPRGRVAGVGLQRHAGGLRGGAARVSTSRCGPRDGPSGCRRRW